MTHPTTGAGTPDVVRGTPPLSEELAIVLAEEEGIEPEGAQLLVLDDTPATPEALALVDAFASRLLRAHRAVSLRIGGLEASRDAEIAQIGVRYAHLIQRQEKELAYLTEGLDTLARQVPFTGKKKSRDTGNGSYGLRTVPASVKVDDEDAVKSWAEKSLPGALAPLVGFKLVRDVLKKHVLESGEVPNGVTISPERQVVSIRYADADPAPDGAK